MANTLAYCDATIIVAAGVNYINLFSLLPTLLTYKLKCLSLAISIFAGNTRNGAFYMAPYYSLGMEH